MSAQPGASGQVLVRGPGAKPHKPTMHSGQEDRAVPVLHLGLPPPARGPAPLPFLARVEGSAHCAELTGLGKQS